MGLEEELKALDVEQNDAGVEEGDDAKESERVRTSMVAVHGWLKLGAVSYTHLTLPTKA